jgi:PHD/YefM family antitoxin component YafN of YafNO toxin-antitoxin module
LQEEDMMLDLTRDFQSLSFFRRKSATFAKLLKKTNRPLVLTHKGKPELVVQNAAAYQRLLDLAARQDAMEGVRQGLEDAANGRTRPTREALAKFRAKRGIPR